ncbi:hypothetical protein BGZ65_006662 [Modicella reniformis]|uniref:Carrier domain-containing protein n=1 Tax=Modicella reniformis TaxID=1440133 RepID=A0A9P6M2M8_9FUNG|nr:hypothetical protein BGZ65_006662 [Modicella reniformis]
MPSDTTKQGSRLDGNTLASNALLLDLPTDRPRHPKQSFAEAQLPIHLGVQLTQSLRQLANGLDVELGVLVMVGWSAILSRLANQDEIVVGICSDSPGQPDSNVLTGAETLPLRIDLSDDPNATQLVKRVKEAALSLKDDQVLASHGAIGKDEPVKAGSSAPPLQVVFHWHNQGVGSSHLQSMQIPLSATNVHADIELHLRELDVEIVGEMRFATKLFDLETIKRHAGYLTTMLKSMTEDSTRPVSAIDILSPAEKLLLLETWNKTSEEFQDHLCIHQLFEQQAEKFPNAVAIVCDDEVLSYGELNSRANRLAQQLIDLGVERETRVAICVKRSSAMIVGILAIMKAGGAYVPLDPNYASERLRDILVDSKPAIVMADATGQAALGESVLSSTNLVDPNALQDYPASNPQVPGLTSSHLAYIIYTSGSTGKPKGVMIEHRGVVDLAQNHTKFCNIHCSSRVLQFASLSFDASVWDIMLPLSCGAALYLPAESIRQDRDKLWEYMARHSVTHASFTPSFLQDGKNLPTINIPLTLVLGGEPLNSALVWNLIAQGYNIVNDFGPTEATVSATTWRCPPGFESEVVPIGRPVIHSRIYLLDKRGRPVPLGTVGEMYIGGVGVARGYLNLPELTAECFLPDPFSGQKDAQMYKTGDLARYLPDGNLVFLGRRDDQVKIRGFRIELGEIETLLVQHPFVTTAAVVVRTIGSDEQLIAYVVSEPRQHLAQELRSYMIRKLPAYMVPVAFVRMDALPLTANDKLDRKMLPHPDQTALALETYEAPQGEIENKLARIWEELLGVERIGRHDNFFVLGGHSLLVVRMLDRLRGNGLTASVRSVYESPVLSRLAFALHKHQAVSVPPNLITPQTIRLTPELLPLIDLTQGDIDHIVEQTPGGLENIQDIYALSSLQDGILFHHLLTTQGDPYLLSSQMTFDSRALLDRYIQSLQMVVDRHDILRTAFIWNDISTPAQVVWRKASLHVQELSLDHTDGPVLKQLDERFNPNHYRIDLTQAPLIRLIVSQDDDGRLILVQLMHHLIGDHLASEMMNLEIERILHNQERTLSQPKPFRNVVAQARFGLGNDSHERFFQEMLADIDEPTFPFGLSEVHQNGAEIVESHQVMPQALNDRLRYQAKQLGVSLASLCHVAWARVLAQTSGQDRVVFGTVLVGVQGADGEDRAMGLSINTLPFRCDMDSLSVQECVRQTHIRLAALLEHEHASLSLAQRCSGVSPGTPPFSALLNYLHTSRPETIDCTPSGMEFVSQEEQVHYPGIELIGVRERTNYPFLLMVEDFDTAIGLTVQILKPIDPARVCGYMRQALESLVTALERSPGMLSLEINILPPQEMQLVLQTWNSKTLKYPEHQTIHGLYEVQVQHTPEAIALVFEFQVMSYAELNARANRLAHKLIELGVKPDTLVAICVERSLAAVVALLAVLKAGGAYVPLDPSYPKQRLEHILEDANPAVLVADAAGKAALNGITLEQNDPKGCGGPIPITILDPNCELSTSSTNPEVPGLTSHHLAYIIYTSGSTGRPKGVMIEHQGPVNLACSRPADFGIDTSSRVLQFSSLAFDVSILEIFATLCTGARLYLLQNEIRVNPVLLWKYLGQYSITHAFLTPGVLLDCKDLPPLSTPITITFAGEALPISLVRALYPLLPNGRIVNDYGPTEIVVSATAWNCPRDLSGDIVPIGRALANKRVYILDQHRRQVPMGAVGELYIGGVGVARGYLNRPELTAQFFVPDPFSNNPNAQMYKSGDLGRFLPDGSVVYSGRNDHQVKIRGFRIELGEIEARLVDHPIVEKATVITLGQGTDKRLVAYVVAGQEEHLAHTLRSHLTSCLPDYMVPAAFVRMDKIPRDNNGKLNRKALPEPDSNAFARQVYEAPQGEMETAIARIWADLLNVDHVSRNDNFFALGGHSLLAVQMIERLRRMNLALPIQSLFKAPTLSVLAQSLRHERVSAVPLNVITEDTATITPDMLPLIDLTQNDIDRIVGQVPGGVTNIQDIYSLSPLQEGILFHHLLATKGDPYLLITCLAFDSRELLDRYIDATQQVVNRHDILRTAFVWENLSTPAQVVWRRTLLPVTEIEFDPSNGPVKDQLMQHLDPRQHRIDLTQAPLLHFTITQDSNGRWLLGELLHHLIGDHSTLELMTLEIDTFIGGRGDTLPSPQSFRNLIFQARSGHSQEDHERYFKEMLADIDTPTLPFGLAEVYGQGHEVSESYLQLPQDLNDRLRTQAKRMGVSLASICHLAWGLVLSRACGEDRVVFGTVLFGRMQSGPGADSAMGLFINTLPLRVDLDGCVQENVLQTHSRLASLLEHEHASLALAQRCSSIPSGTPLFSSLMNYRHNAVSSDEALMTPGIEHLESQERTNYSFTLSVEDYGTSLGLTAMVVNPVNPSRMCSYMQQALHSLADALDHASDTPVRHLDTVPPEEHELLLQTWNGTQLDYRDQQCIHHLIEQQVAQSPEAIALVFEDQVLTYAEMNTRANRMAHKLIELGVKPDTLVAICVERSLAAVVALLAVLKAGGAYVPLDPSYPKQRLEHILEDANPAVLVADAAGKAVLSGITLQQNDPKGNVDDRK